MIWQVHSITGTPVPDISFLLALLVLLLYKGCLVRILLKVSLRPRREG
jgi:hypothetical protein